MGVNGAPNAYREKGKRGKSREQVKDEYEVKDENWKLEHENERWALTEHRMPIGRNSTW